MGIRIQRAFAALGCVFSLAAIVAFSGCETASPPSTDSGSEAAAPMETGEAGVAEADAPETTPDPAARSEAVPKPSLDAELAALTIPPDWLEDVETGYDTNLPWKDARQEIRRLLGLRGESNKEAIKLTCTYREKDDIGDGHEYPMYLFMGGEVAWATKAYEEFTEKLLADPESHDHIHAFLSLAACYSHFGEYEKAMETFNTAMARLPGPPWRIAREADIHDRMGDVYAKLGDVDEAKQHYAEAVQLYPTSKQPYGRHLLKRQATKVQSKIDLLDLESLASATLRDGTYDVQGLGYVGDKPMKVTVVIEGGRIAKIDIEHSEKIDQGATTILPERIIAEQSLQVDAITGATVTCDAIIDAVFRALKEAGLD
jgi:uncharacterized protein with FMN-binding domain